MSEFENIMLVIVGVAAIVWSRWLPSQLVRIRMKATAKGADALRLQRYDAFLQWRGLTRLFVLVRVLGSVLIVMGVVWLLTG
jgi:hypothetical protein